MKRFALLICLLALSALTASAQDTQPAAAPTGAPAAATAPATANDDSLDQSAKELREEQATTPATAPAPTPATTPSATAAPTSRPTSAPAVDKKVLDILNKLQAAGDKHKTIQADIVYTVTDPKVGEEETRNGYTFYQKEAASAPAKFRIHFDTLKQGDGARIKEVVDYAFNGEDLSIAEHKNKKLRRIQVAAPGQKVEPLKIGKGPFPLPFGQKTDDVINFFGPTTRDLLPNEPKGTVYLKLVPLPEHRKEINFAELQMWIDPATYLPVKLISREASKVLTTVLFDKIQVNKELPAESFRMELPRGWTYEYTPLKKAGEE